MLASFNSRTSTSHSAITMVDFLISCHSTLSSCSSLVYTSNSKQKGSSSPHLSTPSLTTTTGWLSLPFHLCRAHVLLFVFLHEHFLVFLAPYLSCLHFSTCHFCFICFLLVFIVPLFAIAPEKLPSSDCYPFSFIPNQQTITFSKG